MARILLIGHGFVGKAVDYAFYNCETFIVDPNYGTTIPNDLLYYDAIFVCVPTPMGIGGSVDTSILDSVLEQVKNHHTVIVKSTVTPDVIDEYDVIYNPEFLTERSAAEQFVSAKFHILGGDRNSTERVEEIYRQYSLCQHAEFLHMTAQEASFVKYTINSFLAMKVTFFNQLYDAIRQLSEIDRGVILLYLEKKSYQEIADITGTNANNIGVRIKRIKERLKKILDGKIN